MVIRVAGATEMSDKSETLLSQRVQMLRGQFKKIWEYANWEMRSKKIPTKAPQNFS